ncbi:uncharacterized protein LOC111381691 [Olea europaea var. sylvestris]|uniref:uncharacterized protein LOC111381691 n=1 Tax=Olea europaea var. sylvestris TaxID=158386 RepID=UPI000C1D6E20|nr:uncharacterized protein LOC111381691 [Olea europaea var. sylvestris]
MRQAPGEKLKSYLARFTDEITYCEQVTDREALSALKDGLNINTLFWRDVRSKNPSTYEELVKMMRIEIVSEEMIDHQNHAAQGLPPPQRQVGRGPAAHLVTQQWTQAGHTIAPTSGQALASATLNVVPVLAYENATSEVGPSGRNDKTFLDVQTEATHIPPGGMNILADQSPQIGEIEGTENSHLGEENQGTKESPVNESQKANRMAPVTFSQEDAQGVHHPHCDALVVRAVVARNGLKRMLVDNGSSVNILFGSTFDKIQIKHGLIPMTDPLFGRGNAQRP